MRKVVTLVTAVVITLTGTVAVTAFGRDASRSGKKAKVTIVSDLWFELVGQLQNSATRVGKLTIYRDPSTNSDFANPDTFRDGTPVLIARYRHQPIFSTLTGTIS